MKIFDRIKFYLARAKYRREVGSALEIMVTDYDGEKTYSPILSIYSMFGFSATFIGVKQFDDIGWCPPDHAIILNIKSPEFATEMEAVQYGVAYQLWLQERAEKYEREKSKTQYLLSDAAQSR